MSAADRRVELSSALTGMGDPAMLTAALDGLRVIVALPDCAQPPVVAAAAVMVSMASRLFGDVAVRGGGRLPANSWGVSTIADAVDVFRDHHGGRASVEREVVVSFGETATAANWYVGGDDWTAVVSARPAALGPCPLGGLGLQAAAALGFGEILKSVLAPLGMRCVKPSGTLVWNLLDGRLAPAPQVGIFRHLDAPPVAVLGAGSLGSSAGAVLAMTPLRGVAHVVDPDRFDPDRNTYRYPAVAPGTTGPKASWVARVLEGSGWEAAATTATVRDWGRARSAPGFDGLALVSVDRVEGRLDAADLLARTTVSAGVAGLALHVQRSIAFDAFACSYCAYVDVAPPMSQVEVYAALTGLEHGRIAQLLDGDELDSGDVAAAVSAGKIAGAGAERLVGGRLEDLLHRHYAQARVPMGGEGLVADVSAPHVSWLGGVLLAAEVVKAAAGLPPLDRRVELDLSGVPLGGWRRPRREASGRCICASPIRRHLANRLYAA